MKLKTLLVVLAIIVYSLVLGCGGRGQVSEAEYDKFLSMDIGMSYADVVDTLGSDGVVSEFHNKAKGNRLQNYEWHLDNAMIVAGFLEGKLVSKDLRVPPIALMKEDCYFEQLGFDSAASGMDYEQVAELMGFNGTLCHEDLTDGVDNRRYVWICSKGAMVWTSFKDDKMYLKAGFGIN